jgi:hypothetical protein
VGLALRVRAAGISLNGFLRLPGELRQPTTDALTAMRKVIMEKGIEVGKEVRGEVLDRTESLSVC